MREDEKTIKIFTLERAHEALLPLIRESFARENIELHFQSKLDTAYDGIFVTQKGFGDIFVFESDRERAKEILHDVLQDFEAPDPEE